MGQNMTHDLNSIHLSLQSTPLPTLLGTNISAPKGIFEDFPFCQVGELSSLEGNSKHMLFLPGFCSLFWSLHNHPLRSESVLRCQALADLRVAISTEILALKQRPP